MNRLLLFVCCAGCFEEYPVVECPKIRRRAEIFRLEVHLLAGGAARRSAGRWDSGRWDSGRRDSGRRDSVGWDSVRWDSVRRARAVAVAEPQGNVPSSG